MGGILLPFCSIFFSTLLVIIFYSKKRINLLENKIYSYMIVLILFDSIIATVLQWFIRGGFTKLEYELIPILNRIDFILLISYTACLFFYTLVITYPEKYKKNFINKVSFYIVIYIISILIMLFLEVNIITDKENFSVSGGAVFLTYITCGFNIFASIIMACANVQKRDKRYRPIYVIILLALFLLFVFLINPYLIVISITFTFINYVMFYSIENPDLKIIEELAQSKERAEKYSNDKAVFLFNMSQQLRAPLKDIELLGNEINNEDDIEVIKSKINDIKISARRLQYIINDSLDISNIDSRQIKIFETKYNIKKIIEEVSLRVKEELKDKPVKYNLVISEDLPSKLYGDSIKMKQILNTLLFNSCKYTKEGFIELNISSVIKHDICRLIIKVEDSGCGIKAELLNKLFEKHDDNNESIDKNSLTLDTLKKLVNLIGGTVSVQSEQKKGTEFTIVIDQKIVEDDEVTNDNTKNYNNDLNYIQRIMFVSDDENYYKACKKMFNSNSNEVIFQCGGEKALNSLRNKDSYDLILIDEKIKKLDVLTIFKKMNLIENFNIPVVVLSDSQDKKDYIKYSSYGIFATLQKPFKQQEIDKIMELIEHRKNK